MDSTEDSALERVEDTVANAVESISGGWRGLWGGGGGDGARKEEEVEEEEEEVNEKWKGKAKNGIGDSSSSSNGGNTVGWSKEVDNNNIMKDRNMESDPINKVSVFFYCFAVCQYCFQRAPDGPPSSPIVIICRINYHDYRIIDIIICTRSE